MAFADKKAAFSYVNEYQKEKYDRITVMAGKGKKAEYQAAAKAAGMSLSAFIEMCVDEKISKGQFKNARQDSLNMLKWYYQMRQVNLIKNGGKDMVEVMTDKQMQFIAWLITTATDKCQTMDEVREMNKEIRKHSTGFKEETEEQKKDE